jgi:hypothetical protein
MSNGDNDGVIERREPSMFDQWARSCLAELVAERLLVVALVSGEAEQIARVSAGDLRTDQEVRFLAGRRMNIGVKSTKKARQQIVSSK